MEYLISLVLGYVASKLQSNRLKKLKRGWRFLIAFTACVLVSCAVNFFNVLQGGTLDLNEILASFAVAFGTSQIYYNLYFRDTLNK